MINDKSVPNGYMHIGTMAKKMGVTVRTLQYYDREGLLSPSAISEGGRRLYTSKDMIKLHQILSLKHLGFSLDEIKNHLISLDTPEEVANVLTEQEENIRKEIQRLTEALNDIEKFRDEVLQMQSVDFKKYADIIINLQMRNEFYWLIKYFDSQTLDHIHNRFDQDTGKAFMQKFLHLQNEAIQLYRSGIPADSAQGQNFAERYWAMVNEFTGGDLNVLMKLVEFGQAEKLNSEWEERQTLANAFIAPALEAYFAKLNVDPFQENLQ
jgi:DNA-binding transcriptional MerR regulator